MEALFIFLGFVLLGLAAARWGADSRDGFRSKEQELASSGVVWWNR